jgi:EAL domain-containing protein (putative c-di-GMP-specific phosphodiesterase class I)
MITQIGEWLLQTACADAAGWPVDIKVAVNLSAVQFRKITLSMWCCVRLRRLDCRRSG